VREITEQLPERPPDAAAEQGEAAGMTSTYVDSTSVARGLHELAEETAADLVIVGSSRHGKAGQTLLGNVAVALMHGSPCAVRRVLLGSISRALANKTPAPLIVYPRGTHTEPKTTPRTEAGSAA
jgi:nucleotide-binding universal stress UspA family protein